MSKKCPISKKGPMSGNTVSHAQNKGKRRFNVGLAVHNLYFVLADGMVKKLKVRISNHALRTIDKIRNTEGDIAAFEFIKQYV